MVQRGGVGALRKCSSPIYIYIYVSIEMDKICGKQIKLNLPHKKGAVGRLACQYGN